MPGPNISGPNITTRLVIFSVVGANTLYFFKNLCVFYVKNMFST